MAGLLHVILMADYKDSLHLPVTNFEMRAGLAQKEPAMIAHWESLGLYEEIQRTRSESPRFVLHDGPPYANGHLHQGHILNKILKDMVIKDRTMRGMRVEYVPGWDCHGLPIEVQVDKELGKKKEGMDKAQIRAACRDYAGQFVDIQRKEFKRLGVLGRWDRPYLTMQYGYEAQTLRELARFVEQGLLYKGLRPVNWCCVHQTALAEAEVEYENHTSPSVYVAFPMETFPQGWQQKSLDVVIWTTTPWTLPANVAVCVHPDLEYVAYPVKGRWCLVAKGLLDAFLQAVGEVSPSNPALIGGLWQGKDLEHLTYRHVMYPRVSPVLLGDHVTLEAGTGCVHTAPAHGAEDFDVCKRYGLPVLSLVDGKGCYTQQAGDFLAGKQVFAANPDISAWLSEKGFLLNALGQTIDHRYAHCWRCHKPIVLRATEQWFVALDKPYAGGASLRERALAALKDVTWVPSWGQDRIYGMLANRPDWCLSRQRTWGVPIAVVYCNGCNVSLVDAALMRKVAEVFEHKGADAWYTDTLESLTGVVECPSCGCKDLRKENDILDVWFDSGVSFAAVVEREGIGHQDGGPSVDLYLEGSDQHRGWFHSSLLCSMATRERPPFKQVLTHGFVVDGQGKKISKSKGNFVDPFKTIETDGAELLRLWVASEDYREDIRVSKEILTRLSESYRKIRNTLRFLLGNVHGFDPASDAVSFEHMEVLDKYAVLSMQRTTRKVLDAYEQYQFHTVVQSLTELCTVELSAFYLDVLKDRLYASATNDLKRRSAQTALYLILRDLVRLLAPVLAFTADEAWAHMPRLSSDPASVHLAYHPWVSGVSDWDSGLREAVQQDAEGLLEEFVLWKDLRKKVHGVMEEARREKVIGSSVEACVTLTPTTQLKTLTAQRGEEFVADLLIVSKVCITSEEASEVGVVVSRVDGTKCARCWLYRDHVSEEGEHVGVCDRCSGALNP